MSYFVFILRCHDGTFYTDLTTDLEHELERHNSGVNPKSYTFNRRPVRLEWHQYFPDEDTAVQALRKLRGWSAQKKESLLQKNFDQIQSLAECRNATHHKYKN